MKMNTLEEIRERLDMEAKAFKMRLNNRSDFILGLHRDFIRNVTRHISSLYREKQVLLSKYENTSCEIEKAVAELRLDAFSEFLSELESGNVPFDFGAPNED